MSEFLRVLDLRESEILKTMIVRFAIESVEASQGSLIVYDPDKNVLKYQDTYMLTIQTIRLFLTQPFLKATATFLRFVSNPEMA